jgi:hypothetical protein
MGFDLGLGQFVATLEGVIDKGFDALHGVRMRGEDNRAC